MSYTIPPRRAPQLHSTRPSRPRQPQQHEREEEEGATDQTNASSSSVQGQGTSQGTRGYHVIVPDPGKNSKLKQTAKDEEDAHRLHRQLKRPSSFQTSSRLGGDPLSMEDVREAQSKEARINTKMAPIRRQMDRERRMEERDRKEMEQIMEHKQRQRIKSEMLEKKQEIEGPARLEEMRKKRLAYFVNK